MIEQEIKDTVSYFEFNLRFTNIVYYITNAALQVCNRAENMGLKYIQQLTRNCLFGEKATAWTRLS